LTNLTNRDDAERIAREHLAAGGFAPVDVAFTVRTLAEIAESGICGPILYPDNLQRSLATSWLVYVRDPQPVVWASKSSRIVVVSRTDGTVLYSGSAHDEG
jgi:hypothetical protein